MSRNPAAGMIHGSKGPYPYDEGQHLIVALREWVYADESGIHDDALFCVVAGYRGSVEQWKKFNREWQAVLNKPEYRIKGGFHSKIFFNRKLKKNSKGNPYFGWPDNKARVFIDELLSVIDKRKIRPIGCAVNVNEFQTFSYGEQSTLVGYFPEKSMRQHRLKLAPYHLAVRAMVEDSLFGVASTTELHFVIAEQKELQQRALDGYYLTKELWSKGERAVETAAVRQLKGMGVEAPVDFPGLQAADLFANRWYNALVHNMRVGLDNRKIMKRLTRKRRDLPICDVIGIEKMFAESGITPEARSQLRAIEGPS